MTQRLAGKVAMVTGCGSSGSAVSNGRAISILLAREGAWVFGGDINLKSAQETQSLIQAEGGRCEVMATDVSDPKQVEALVQSCVATAGRIDILVNNVGVTAQGGAVDYPLEKWRRDLDINVTSMFLTCKHVLPLMEKQGGGSIINMSSVSGIRSVFNYSQLSYDTTKAAVLGFSRSIALKYAARNIRSNVVMPGLIDTPILMNDSDVGAAAEHARQCPMQRMGEAWDIAEAVLYLASDASKYVTGTQLVVDGGISAKFALEDAYIQRTSA